MNSRDELLATTKPGTVGMSFPAMHGTGGLFTKSSGLPAILAGLKQLLLTSKGERVMMPTYGTRIRALLFSQDDASFRDEVRTEIFEAITQWEPRVQIKDIGVMTDNRVGREGYQAIRIKLNFSIVGHPHTEQELTLLL